MTLTTTWITSIFITLVMTRLLLELFLDYRHYRHINAQVNQVPSPFDQTIELKQHQLAAAYASAKLSSGAILNSWHTIILLLWTFGGGLDLLDQLVRSQQASPITAALLAFSIFALIEIAISIPESLYRHFILEERFGFNRLTIKLFIFDQLKGLILSAVIGLPLLAVIIWIVISFQSTWWFYAWVLITIFQLSTLWLYPVLIAPLFNKFSPLTNQEVKTRVLQLLERVGFSSKGLFVMDASRRTTHGNAYFTGPGKSKRIVLFDTLLKTLSPDEVEAVIAHELGHYKNRDILKMLLVSSLLTLTGFAILGWLYQLPEFYLAHGVTNQSPYMALLLFGVVVSCYTFPITPILSWRSRRQEFAADRFAAQFAQKESLASALIKMYRDNATPVTADPLYSAYHHSHPQAAERIARLLD
jgi:STE24 endopeptidase